MAGYGEQAGHGIPVIYRGWRKQLWRAPILQEKVGGPEQTFLTLPLLSLLSQETVAALERRFGSRYQQLSEVQQMALATVAVEDRVTHARLKSVVYAHPRDISAALAALCRDGFLESSGATRGTYYYFPGEPPEGKEETPGGLFDQADSGQRGPSSEHKPEASERSGLSPERWELLLGMALPLRRTRRARPDLVEATLIAVCKGNFLTLKQLEKLTGRRADSLRVHYLNRMGKEGTIKLRYPEAPSHPNQAYTSDPSGSSS